MVSADWSTEAHFAARQLEDANLLRSAVLSPGEAAVSEVMAVVGGAPAFLSSSSLSDPPEELLSEATSGACLASPAAPDESPASADTRAKTVELSCCSDGTGDLRMQRVLTVLLVVLFGLFLCFAAA